MHSVPANWYVAGFLIMTLLQDVKFGLGVTAAAAGISPWFVVYGLVQCGAVVVQAFLVCLTILSRDPEPLISRLEKATLAEYLASLAWWVLVSLLSIPLTIGRVGLVVSALQGVVLLGMVGARKRVSQDRNEV